MTQEIFDDTVKLFKKRFNILEKRHTAPQKAEDQLERLKMGIVEEEYDNPWNWMLEYVQIEKDIVSYFDSINEEWCKEFHEERKINSPDKNTKHSPIFVDFKVYVDNLINENYVECDKIRDKILTSY